MDRRMVDGSVWSNENFASLPPLGRLLQLGLINLADDQGRSKANPIYVRSQVFPYDMIEMEQIRVWLSQMVSNGTIMLYQHDGKDYLQFCNWWQYQSLNFAKPSDYPPPDGWLDRIRFNGKGNITLTHNWYKSDGTLIDDTCDAHGKPLPFVEQMPRKNLGGRPSQQGKEEEKVPTFPSTFPPTFPSTFPPGNVIQQQDQDQQKLNTTEVEVKTNNNSALRALTLKEAEKAVVVVGVDSLIAKFDSDQTMALLSWLWLYNGWFDTELIYRDRFRRLYPHDPFLRMKSVPAVIVDNARSKSPAPLLKDDRAEMMDALRRVQEVQS